MPPTTSAQRSDPATVLRTLERVRAAVPMALLANFHPLAHVDEYTKFLALKVLRDDVDVLPPALSPSHLVDAVWHTHMLHPHEYVRTCAQLLSYRRAPSMFNERMRGADSIETLHLFKHSPVPRADSERYTTTVSLYETAFGVKPNSLVWPDEATSSATSPPTLPATSYESSSETSSSEIESAHCYMISIKTMTGEVWKLRTSPDASVDDLKEWIQHKTGACNNRLIFAGRQLESGRALSDYDVQSGATIHHVLSLRGC